MHVHLFDVDMNQFNAPTSVGYRNISQSIRESAKFQQFNPWNLQGVPIIIAKNACKLPIGLTQQI